MRAFLLLVPVLFAACGPTASQREVLTQAKLEVARREPWARTALIFIENPNENYRFNWQVKAGAYDYTGYPHYSGLHMVPGTERELLFDPAGCLISYTDAHNPCLTSFYTTQTEVLMVPAK
jgi:hypothetical protein